MLTENLQVSEIKHGDVGCAFDGSLKSQLSFSHERVSSIYKQMRIT